MDCQIRALVPQDHHIVWQMLMLAAHETTLDAVKNQHFLSIYAENWGREGDMGFVALVNQQPIGAAWLRLWPDEEKGFGFVDKSTPELAMAVLSTYQGQGIGTQLLRQVLARAKDAYPAVSLNVRADNPALRLYQRAGFVEIEGSEVVNRTGSISFNMIIKF